MMQTVLWWAGALLVALLVVLATRRANYGDGPHWAVVLLLLVVAGNVAWFGDRYMSQRRADQVSARVLAEMESEPVFASIKDSDPATYAKMRQVVLDTEVFPEGERADRAKVMIQPVIMEFMAPRISNPSDDILVRSARLGVEIAKRRMAGTGRCDIREIRYSDADSWRKWREGLTPDENKRFEALMVDTIRFEPNMSPKIYDGNQVKTMIAARLPMLLQNAGIPIETIGQAPDDATRCRIGIMMIEDILSMPPEQAAPTLRSFAKVTMS